MSVQKAFFEFLCRTFEPSPGVAAVGSVHGGLHRPMEARTRFLAVRANQFSPYNVKSETSPEFQVVGSPHARAYGAARVGVDSQPFVCTENYIHVRP
jgi:hypothetical protein